MSNTVLKINKNPFIKLIAGFTHMIILILLSLPVAGEQKKLPKLYVHKVKLGAGVPQALESQIRKALFFLF